MCHSVQDLQCKGNSDVLSMLSIVLTLRTASILFTFLCTSKMVLYIQCNHRIIKVIRGFWPFCFSLCSSLWHPWDPPGCPGLFFKGDELSSFVLTSSQNPLFVQAGFFPINSSFGTQEQPDPVPSRGILEECPAFLDCFPFRTGSQQICQPVSQSGQTKTAL